MLNKFYTCNGHQIKIRNKNQLSIYYYSILTFFLKESKYFNIEYEKNNINYNRL